MSPEQQVNPQLELRHFTVCDDVRPELGGKFTLVGVYGRAMRIAKVPGMLPKLCFVAEFPLQTESKVFGLRLISPSGAVLFESEQNEPQLQMAGALDGTSIPSEFRHSLFVIQLSPMVLDEEGRYIIDYAFAGGPTLQADFFVAQESSPLPQVTTSLAGPHLTPVRGSSPSKA